MCPQYFALLAAGFFATFIPWDYLPLFHVICGHKHLGFCLNSQQSLLIKAICIFCKVHLHSQGFLFLFMLNSHTAKQSTLGVLSCHRLLAHKVNYLEFGLAGRLSFLEHSSCSAVFEFIGGNPKKCLIWIVIPNCNFLKFIYSIFAWLSTCHLYLTGGMYAIMEGELGVTYPCN